LTEILYGHLDGELIQENEGEFGTEIAVSAPARLAVVMASSSAALAVPVGIAGAHHPHRVHSLQDVTVRWLFIGTPRFDSSFWFPSHTITSSARLYISHINAT
jgi:hypothetical protein